MTLLEENCEVIVINGTNYLVELNTNTLRNLYDDDEVFDMGVTPYCAKCKKVMEFYHSVDKIYDRYTCADPCMEDRWVLKEFTPREEDLYEDDSDNPSEVITPQMMIMRLEDMGYCISQRLWESGDLQIYLDFITRSELHFHYYIQVLVMYTRDSDVFVAGTSIHGYAADTYRAYQDSLEYQTSNSVKLAQAYPFKPEDYPRPPRPLLANSQISSYIKNLFDNLL